MDEFFRQTPLQVFTMDLRTSAVFMDKLDHDLYSLDLVRAHHLFYCPLAAGPMDDHIQSETNVLESWKSIYKLK
ncbi:hypothetical protein BGX24_004606, partial [Mortierella sp. AD032]